jgi:hypothetical protein
MSDVLFSVQVFRLKFYVDKILETDSLANCLWTLEFEDISCKSDFHFSF